MNFRIKAQICPDVLTSHFRVPHDLPSAHASAAQPVPFRLVPDQLVPANHASRIQTLDCHFVLPPSHHPSPPYKVLCVVSDFPKHPCLQLFDSFLHLQITDLSSWKGLLAWRRRGLRCPLVLRTAQPHPFRTSKLRSDRPTAAVVVPSKQSQIPLAYLPFE